MTPSQTAKHHGCKSLAELSRVTRQSEQTLINWHKHKPELFDVVCLGVAALKSSCVTNEMLETAQEKKQ